MFGTPPKAPEESVKAYASRMLSVALDHRDRHPGRPAQILVDCMRERFEQVASHVARHGTRS